VWVCGHTSARSVLRSYLLPAYTEGVGGGDDDDGDDADDDDDDNDLKQC
jgi:hypothetical protein